MRQRRAFTVVDLLVVLALALVAAALAAPALAGARRSSRMAIDLSNLAQHAVMKENHVAANKGRMPNAPAGIHAGKFPEPGEEPFTGPPTRPARVLAHPDLPHNGWSIAQGLGHDEIWRMYHIAFGDYLVDGQGLDMLQDVFLSPGEPFSPLFDFGAHWTALREGGAPALETIAFQRLPLAANNPFGTTFEQSDLAQSDRWKLAPSYRYTLAGLVGSYEFCEPGGRGFFGPFGAASSCPLGLQAPWHESAGQWSSYREWVQASDFAHPARKVMFTSLYNHGRTPLAYNRPGAECAIVMVDGSVRASLPSEEMPSRDSLEYREAMSMGEPWSAGLDVSWSGQPLVGQQPWFIYTLRGHEGYDFR